MTLLHEAVLAGSLWIAIVIALVTVWSRDQPE